MIANLAWLDQIDIESWLLVTIVGVAAGAAIWIFAGLFWLLLVASLYLALLVAVRVVVVRAERKRKRRR